MWPHKLSSIVGLSHACLIKTTYSIGLMQALKYAQIHMKK